MDSLVNQLFFLLEFSHNSLELCYEKNRQARIRVAELETENKLLKLQLEQFQLAKMNKLHRRRMAYLASLSREDQEIDDGKESRRENLTCPQCQRQFSTRDGPDFLRHVRECFPCTQEQGADNDSVDMQSMF